MTDTKSVATSLRIKLLTGKDQSFSKSNYVPDPLLQVNKISHCFTIISLKSQSLEVLWVVYWTRRLENHFI